MQVLHSAHFQFELSLPAAQQGRHSCITRPGTITVGVLMELGMIGLGKMGAAMVERLRRAGHRLVGYDRDPAAVQHVTEKGATPAASLDALVSELTPPRAIWIMVPSGDPVDQTIQALLPNLTRGDILIDGGNSNYK